MLQGTGLRVGLDAHVVGRRQTGNETYVIELGTALARRGDLDVVAYVDSDVTWPRPAGPELRRLRWRSRYLRISVELPIRARADRLRLLHVQYVAPPVSPTPVVAIVHDVSFIDASDAFRWRTSARMRATIGATVRRAAMILTGSQFSRERLMEHYRLHPDRIDVTPYGVDGRWRPLSGEEVRERLAAAGLADLPPRFVLVVGNLHPRKNIPRLIRALAAVRGDGHKDLSLLLVGQRQWGGMEIDAEIARHHASDWVRATGYVSDETVVALMNRAAIVAYPSLYEGFGLPVLEALACGSVVVASNRTSIPEVAGDAALLVDPTSDDDLAAGILAAITKESLRRRLSAAGPSRAATFSWDRCASDTAAAYRKVVIT